MRGMRRRTIIFIITLISVVSISLAQAAAAMSLSGLGSPSSHPELAGGSVIDFEANAVGENAITFGYAAVLMTGNNVLRITDAYSGSFNVTGNSLALTANDRTQELTFTFLSPVAAFGFNFGGTDFAWRLSAYSAADTLLDELTITPFGSSNNGEWFGLSAPGIASAKLFNTAFANGSDTGSLDYVVLDNFTSVSAVPEPATFILMGLSLTGLFLGRRLRHNDRV